MYFLGHLCNDITSICIICGLRPDLFHVSAQVAIPVYLESNKLIALSVSVSHRFTMYFPRGASLCFSESKVRHHRYVIIRETSKCNQTYCVMSTSQLLPLSNSTILNCKDGIEYPLFSWQYFFSLWVCNFRDFFLVLELLKIQRLKFQKRNIKFSSSHDWPWNVCQWMDPQHCGGSEHTADQQLMIQNSGSNSSPHLPFSCRPRFGKE